MYPADPLRAEILDEETLITLSDLCRVCGADEGLVEALIEEGVIPVLVLAPAERRFSAAALRRTRIAVRLHRDLGVNLPGVALALDLLEELEQLRRQRSIGR